jgi:hypothetical protein
MFFRQKMSSKILAFLARNAATLSCIVPFWFLLHLRTIRNNWMNFLIFKILPLYTLAGFDLLTHSSSLLDGRRRRYHLTTPPGHNLMLCSNICRVVHTHRVLISFGRNLRTKPNLVKFDSCYYDLLLLWL